MDIIWHDPPPKVTGKYGAWFLEFVNLLKDNPGCWGELPTMPGDTSYSNTSQTTLRKHYPEVEFTARPIPGNPNRVRIWGRYTEPVEMGPLRAVEPHKRAERVSALMQQKKG